MEGYRGCVFILATLMPALFPGAVTADALRASDEDYASYSTLDSDTQQDHPVPGALLREASWAQPLIVGEDPDGGSDASLNLDEFPGITIDAGVSFRHAKVIAMDPAGVSEVLAMVMPFLSLDRSRQHLLAFDLADGNSGTLATDAPDGGHRPPFAEGVVDEDGGLFADLALQSVPVALAAPGIALLLALVLALPSAWRRAVR